MSRPVKKSRDFKFVAIIFQSSAENFYKCELLVFQVHKAGKQGVEKKVFFWKTSVENLFSTHFFKFSL